MDELSRTRKRRKCLPERERGQERRPLRTWDDDNDEEDSARGEAVEEHDDDPLGALLSVVRTCRATDSWDCRMALKNMYVVIWAGMYVGWTISRGRM
jgi:hypothetical protein